MTIDQLQSDDTAFVSGNRVLLGEHGFYYYLTTNDYNGVLQIDSVAFFTQDRAEQMLAKSGELVSYDEMPKGFMKEFESKILESAEDYLGLIQEEECKLVVGFTTDTLKAVDYDSSKKAVFLKILIELMENGEAGAYLSFRV